MKKGTRRTREEALTLSVGGPRELEEPAGEFRVR